jgi:putative aldouronate transport system permease protein
MVFVEVYAVEMTSTMKATTARTRISIIKMGNYFRQNWALLLLALPGVVFFLLFNYVPMFGVVVAFQDYNVNTGFFSPWIGFHNFKLLWQSPVLVRILRNTIVLNSLFIIAGTISSVTIALLLNEVRSRIFKSASQLVMFLPFFMSWAIVSMLLYGLFDYNVGSVNRFLVELGVEKVAFTSNPDIWPLILTGVRVWKYTGSDCIIYLAVLVSIDPQLYESAAIDGAGRFARMRYISLPGLVPTIIILTLLAIGRIFYGDYGMLYALVGQNPMLYETTDVIDTYILRALRTNTGFGMSAAVGLSQSLLGFIFVLGSNLLVKWWSRRRGESYELF